MDNGNKISFSVSDYSNLVESYRNFKDSINKMPEHIRQEFKPILEAIYNRLDIVINFIDF